MKTKLSILLGISALAFLFSVSPVLAASGDVTQENKVTGQGSNNENKADVDEQVDVDVENDGDVKNDADVDCDTGPLTANNNTTFDGDQKSGKCDATGTWESVVNAQSSLLAANGGGVDWEVDQTNDITGQNSNNENDVDVDYKVDLDLKNLADITNDLDFDGDTGSLTANNNTEFGGSQESGDIMLVADIGNWANNDAGWMGAGHGSVAVDATQENHKTGQGSNNENDVDVDYNYDRDVKNDADIKNDVDVDADTGPLTANNNTTFGGSQESGAIEVMLSLENSANNGGGALWASDGGVDVKADQKNDTTGQNSNNENDVDVDVKHDVDVKNDADIKNDVDVDADSGSLTANNNTTFDGDQQSGDITVELNISNEVNSSM